MAKIFLSYKFTGEEYGPLRELLNKIEKHLKEKGHEVFCSIDLQQFYKQNGMTSYQSQLDYCLDQQEGSDMIISILKCEELSNGMVEELKKADEFGQEKLLLIKKGLKFKTFRGSAKQIVEFNDESEILSCLDKLKIN
jgi:hypothetical protein